MSGGNLIKTIFLAMGLLLAMPVLAHAQADEDAKAKAKIHFEQGVELFKNSDYDAALVEFKAAYKAKPHFAVRYNVGICLFKLHRYGEANLELSAYLAEGGEEIPADKKQEVESIMKDLDKLLGTLKVECNVDGALLLIDGQPYGSWLVRVDVGEHEIEISAKDYKSFKTKVEVPGGEMVKVDAQLVPTKPGKVKKANVEKTAKAPKPDKTPGTPMKKSVPKKAFWAMLGVTGALTLTAAIIGGAALSKSADYKKLSYEDDNWKTVRDEGRRLTVATDVLWGMVAAAGATTLVLVFFTDFKKEKVAVSMSPAPGSLALSVEVTF